MVTKHTVKLYSKPGCHLCENAKAALEGLEKQFPYSLQEFDITQDPVIFEKYRYLIPVMIIDDAIELEGRIDSQKLYRALAEGYGPKVK